MLLPKKFLHISDASVEVAAEMQQIVEQIKTDRAYPAPSLLAVSGSYAYGLAHAKSDVDIRGVFVAPMESFLGLDRPTDKPVSSVDPDLVMYELGVFFKLALASNPNIVELLWLDQYEHLDEVGTALLEYRDKFVSQRARTTYIGFATSQLRETLLHLDRIEEGDESIRPRMEKHVRHTFRILDQGISLLETGDLQVRVTNPAELYQYSTLTREEIVEKFDEKKERVNTADSVLVENPDMVAANTLLLKLRKLAAETL